MRWYTQAGTPKVTVRGAYDAAARTYRLDIAQSLAPTPGQTDKLPATMPLALGLVDPQGGEFPLDGPPMRAKRSSPPACSS